MLLGRIFKILKQSTHNMNIHINHNINLQTIAPKFFLVFNPTFNKF